MNFWENYIKILKELESQGANIFCIGKSALRRPIFCVKIGNGSKKILIQYAIHAREHITFHLGVLQAKRLLRQNLDASVYFVLCSNPDGVCLATDGIKSICRANQDVQNLIGHFPFFEPEKPLSPFYLQKLQKQLLKVNGSSDFSNWKASATCVDLNVNFDANWGKGKQNIFELSGQNYVGKFAESEPETKALANFVKILKPAFTISYHSKGEVIFFQFGQRGKRLLRDRKIANEISKTTGYLIRKARGSVGGFKDYCIQKLGIPSVTIEIGAEELSHPIGKENLVEIFEQNKFVIEKSLALL